jgi:Plasmid stabilization system protein
MQVKWLRTALHNLEREAEHIARDNPGAAAGLVAEAHSATQLLAQHPEIGLAGRVPGTRELVLSCYPYVIPYRVNAQRIEILRVFHTSRKWPSRFDPK